MSGDRRRRIDKKVKQPARARERAARIVIGVKPEGGIDLVVDVDAVKLEMDRIRRIVRLGVARDLEDVARHVLHSQFLESKQRRGRPKLVPDELREQQEGWGLRYDDCKKKYKRWLRKQIVDHIFKEFPDDFVEVTVEEVYQWAMDNR